MFYLSLEISITDYKSIRFKIKAGIIPAFIDKTQCLSNI